MPNQTQAYWDDRQLMTRRVYSEGGAEEEVLVDCPRDGRWIDLEKCVSCQHCRGVSLGPPGAPMLVRCAYPHDAPVDRVTATAARPTDRPADATAVSTVMSRDVLCVSPQLSVEALTEMLLERQISGAPVVDPQGHPVGMVTKTNLIVEQHEHNDGVEEWVPERHHLERGYHVTRLARATVGEIMTPVVYTLPESASIAEGAALMAYWGVHRVIVVSTEGKVSGVLSSLDLARWLAEQTHYLRPRRHQ